MKRTLVTTLLAGTALVLGAVAGSTAARADSSRVDGVSSAKTCGQTGAGTGDWEVSFGTRVIRRKANALLARVRRKGFRRALIEREQCLYEVSIIHLSHERANTLASRARRKAFRVLVVQS
jgi:cell division septation protein DedD